MNLQKLKEKLLEKTLIARKQIGMNFKREIKNTTIATCIAVLAAGASFVTYEPSLLGAATSQFTVSTTITPEISFSTAATNVSLGSVPGQTGGTLNGGTQVVVATNDSLGYTMTIVSSSSPALVGNTQGGTIPDYVPTVNATPDFSFVVAANKAGFGYTVEASTSSDLAPAFLDNSTTCGVGSTDTVDKCWYRASTTAKTIVNRTTVPPSSGATTTIKFRLTINSNPTPSITNDTYVATSTLTATAN